MSLSRVEQVQTPDGAFDLTVWLPEAGAGPGLLLIQEIFGVSDYIRAVAGDLAALGYVVAAPDLFWRIEPGYQARHDEAGVARSLQMGGRFDVEKGAGDCAAALAKRHGDLPPSDLDELRDVRVSSVTYQGSDKATVHTSNVKTSAKKNSVAAYHATDGKGLELTKGPGGWRISGGGV